MTETQTDLFQSMWDAPLSRRGTLSLTNSDNPVGIRLIGEHHDLATIISATPVPEFGTVVTIHIEGGQHWAGRAMRASHGAQIMTVVVRPNPKGKGMFHYVQLSRIDAPRNAVERAERTATFRAVLEAEWAS